LAKDLQCNQAGGVVCGPGGILWGANAVNGVINIITKKAEQTQGALLALRQA